MQFDRSTSNIYKSNAFLRFDKVIYLDRYLDKNYELLKQRRQEAHNWKQDIDRLQAELNDYEQDKVKEPNYIQIDIIEILIVCFSYMKKTTRLSKVDLLKLTADFIHDEMKNDIIDENSLVAVEQESNLVKEESEGRLQLSDV